MMRGEGSSGDSLFKREAKNLYLNLTMPFFKRILKVLQKLLKKPLTMQGECSCGDSLFKMETQPSLNLSFVFKPDWSFLEPLKKLWWCG